MAWINLSFRSKTLNMPVEAEAFVPQRQGGGFKVIVLLHDIGADRTEWVLKSPVFHLAENLPAVVFTVSAKNSFYVNTANGYRYMDYITDEIPKFIETHFRVSASREDWLIAGVGMGGYGALACGLNGCSQFGNIASLGGTLDILNEPLNISSTDMEMLFGSDAQQRKESNNNIYSYCHKVPENLRPRIFQYCGLRDSSLEMNQRFYEEIKAEYEVCYIEEPGGHDFEDWNRVLPQMLQWFLNKN